MCNQHLGSPAIITQGFKDWIQSECKRLLRASFHAKEIIFPALKSDTFVLLGPQWFGKIVIPYMNAIRTKLSAKTAGNAI